MPSRVAFVLLLCAPCAVHGQDARKPLILIDGADKNIPLKDWSFATGTKHLTWLAPKEERGKKDAGPEYLEFRVTKAEMYQEDVTTYIPLSALKEIEYDHKAKEVAVTLVNAEGKDVTLRGPTKFKAINQFTIDGAVAPTTFEIGGAVRLTEGAARFGFKKLKFPEPTAAAAVAGAEATVVVRGKEKVSHTVHGLVPLYRVGGGYRLVPSLFFQKTVVIDWPDVAKMTHMAPAGKKGGLLDFEVEKRDGTKQGLTLLEKTSLGEKEAGVLVGLIARAGGLPVVSGDDHRPVRAGEKK
ncbi:MAG: hypothetical protein U0793_10000 [Gemmataceae bacterium]